MSESPADRDDQPSPSIAPTLQLSRRGLVLSFLSMVAAGLSVYALFPSSVGGPPLPVEVYLDKQPVESANGMGAILTEVVVVKNLTEHEIPRLTLDINGQYLLFRDPPLGKREVLVLPQRVFTDKRSSQRFNPSKYAVDDVVATGQLPSGARGVTKFEFEGEAVVSAY
jgi:hypothetical protein